MLIEFRVANYKSLKDEQVLSMVASADSSLPENTIATDALGGRRLLRSAVVYGANASGKSNLMDALGFVKRFVAGLATSQPGAGIPIQPFRLDPTPASAPSRFELTFLVDGTRYQYGFAVDRERVHEEWLLAYPNGRGQTWFERPSNGADDPARWYFGPGLKGEKRRLVSLLRRDALFLSVAASFAHAQLAPLHKWFLEHLRIVSLASSTDELLAERQTAQMIRHADGFQPLVERLVRFADLGVTGLEVADVSLRDRVGEANTEYFAGKVRAEWLDQKEPVVTMRHKGSDRGAEAPFDPEDESRGTRRFVALLGPWLDALIVGRTLIVDELDTSLHPALLRQLVSMFNSSLGNNAQLVFNTHDTSLLDTSLFRRDQIWFIEKDRGGASHLYPLLDYKPRKGEALAKGYLQGRYGAIPFTGDMEKLDLGEQE